MWRWSAGVVLGLFACGCGGASTRKSAPLSVDPFVELPTFDVELVSEIALEGELAAEAISLRDGLIQLYDSNEVRVFSSTGQLVGSNDDRRARGSDDFLTSDSGWVSAWVFGQALLWNGPFEPAAVLLPGVTSATGLGMGHDRDQCEGCIYVADGPAKLVAEYAEPARLLRILPLPETDPEGVAVAKSGRVYVADGERSRLLRADPTLTRVEALADLPGAEGKHPSGLAFDDVGQLYVCFRDWSTVLVLTVSDERFE